MSPQELLTAEYVADMISLCVIIGGLCLVFGFGALISDYVIVPLLKRFNLND